MLFSDIQNPTYVVWAFAFQLVLIAFFALRRLNLDLAVKYGWVIYALSLPSIVVSIQQINAGNSWTFWVGGFIYLAWSVLGFLVEYVLNLTWRSPIVLRIFVPYVGLYLATVMFYWWPLGEIHKGYWYGAALLFVLSTILNVTSHRKQIHSGTTS